MNMMVMKQFMKFIGVGVKMKQLKDMKHIEAKITITKIREVFKESKNLTSFKDKLLWIKISKPTYNTYTSFKCNKKGKKELLNFIREELYLK